MTSVEFVILARVKHRFLSLEVVALLERTNEHCDVCSHLSSCEAMSSLHSSERKKSL